MSSEIETELKKIIGADSIDLQKYERYAEIASKEGLNNLKLLFQGLSKGKNTAITNLKQALGDPDYQAPETTLVIETSLENVQKAIIHSTEALNVYKKGHLKDLYQMSDDELGALAYLAAKWSAKLEKTHQLVIKYAQKKLKGAGNFPEVEIFICRVCGNLILDEPERLCPICDHDPVYYEKVSEIQTEGEN